MAVFDFDIGVLGGGAAGLTVTAGAAQLGAKTILIEKEHVLGGDCLHYGCVPSKTLIKTAKVYHQMKQASFYGLPPVDMKPVEYKNVVKRIREVIAEIQKHDSPERFCKLGARVEFGDPHFTNEHTVQLNGKQYSARNWVVATGSSPVIPQIEGLNKSSYITNKEIFFLDHLPESMIVLGAGPIALEMAQSFCRLGCRVTVIQRSGQVLTKEDKDMADIVMEALQEEGVTFYLNTQVKSVKELIDKKEVHIEFQGKSETLTAESILVALGRTPNVSYMRLEEIGVEASVKGITVDNRLRTSRKHIYAAGDVTGAYQFTHAAGYEGGVVLTNAIFRLPRKVDYTYLPWCTFTGPELASIGMNEKMAVKAGIQYTTWIEEFKNNDRSLAEGEHRGKIKMLLDKKERPIGVQILGLHAGDLLGEWAVVLNAKVKLSTLASAVHPYPTLSEINKRVAGTFLSGKIFSERMKRGLKFFFNLKGRACCDNESSD